MKIELDRPMLDAETLRKEWQDKFDPNLADLKGMRKYIEKRLGGETQSIPGESGPAFNTIQQ